MCTVWTHKLIWLWIRNECIKSAVLQKNSIQICTIYKHIQNMFKNCKQNENKHLWYKDIDIKNVTLFFLIYHHTHFHDNSSREDQWHIISIINNVAYFISCELSVLIFWWFKWTCTVIKSKYCTNVPPDDTFGHHCECVTKQ